MAGLQRVGAFVGPAAGGVLAAWAGYAVAFGVGAAGAAVAVVLVLTFAAQGRDARDASGGTLTGVVTVLRDHHRVLATAGLAALALQLMRATRQLLVPLF